VYLYRIRLPEGAENGPILSTGIINLVVLLGGLACGCTGEGSRLVSSAFQVVGPGV